MNHLFQVKTIVIVFSLSFATVAVCQDLNQVEFPEGTTAKVVNGKWVIYPPSIEEQEIAILKEEKQTESKLGRLYHIHFIFNGDKRLKTAGTLSEAIEEVSMLNRKHSTTGYYVVVGTKY